MIAPDATVVEAAHSAPSAAPADLLTARAITKRFNGRPILRGVELRLKAGERVALFGPNGAGKTTLMRILCTLMQPSSGQVVIGGLATDRQAAEARRKLGVVAAQPFIYPDLTAGENLRFFARMYDVADAPARIAQSLELVGLAARADDRAGTFSRGMLQRLTLARSILHDPPVLLFDEPDTGLDRDGLRVLEAILERQVTRGGSVLFTTHDLRFGLANAERALLLRAGRIAFDAPAEVVSEAELDDQLLGRG